MGYFKFSGGLFFGSSVRYLTMTGGCLRTQGDMCFNLESLKAMLLYDKFGNTEMKALDSILGNRGGS